MKSISFSLSVDSISHALQRIDDYQKSIAEKNQRFVELLLEKGITVVQEKVADGTHHMPDLITFSAKVEVEGGKTAGALMGVGSTFISQWIAADGSNQVSTVYPMSMMEFGSAGLALEPQEAFGGFGGQGTFTYSGHSGDVQWSILEMETTEESPSWASMKRGTAIAPTRPLYNAMIAMEKAVQEAAKEAFGGD